MCGKMSLLRHSRKAGNIRYTSLRRYKRNLFMGIVVAATVIIYVTTRILVRRPVHVLVRFADHENDIREGFNFIFGHEDFAGKQKSRVSSETRHTTRLLTSSHNVTIKHSDVSTRRRISKWKLNPINKCKNNAPYLIILISSHESMTSSRDVIRKTWCKKKAFSGNRNVICMFLLGHSNDSNDNITSDVIQEYKANRDVIKQSFLDTFRNSTTKLLMGLEWVKRYCPSVRYVMKTEDDVIVNTEVIMEKHLSRATSENYFTGKCWSDSPNRNPNSRFYVSEDEYPAENYPVYCGGTGYLMSVDVTKRLFEESRRTKSLPLDDVFAGVLLQRIHVTPLDTPGFLVSRFDEDTPCSNMTNAATIHAHGMDIQHVWDNMAIKCRS